MPSIMLLPSSTSTSTLGKNPSTPLGPVSPIAALASCDQGQLATNCSVESDLLSIVGGVLTINPASNSKVFDATDAMEFLVKCTLLTSSGDEVVSVSRKGQLLLLRPGYTLPKPESVDELEVHPEDYQGGEGIFGLSLYVSHEQRVAEYSYTSSKCPWLTHHPTPSINGPGMVIDCSDPRYRSLSPCTVANVAKVTMLPTEFSVDEETLEPILMERRIVQCVVQVADLSLSSKSGLETRSNFTLTFMRER